MWARRLGLVGILVYLAYGQAKAQTFSYTDTLKAPASGDTLALKHNNLVPGTVLIKTGGNIVPPSAYTVVYDQGLLVFSIPLPEVIVAYRTFAKPLPPPQRLLAVPDSQTGLPAKRDLSWLYKEYDTYPQPALDTVPRWQATAQLQRSGSISRAVTVGTGRDVSVTSDFRLNLAGNLSEDIGIAASITDQNLPIQPSGTTQQLTDFDQIFIRLTRQNSTLTFGDLELQQRGTFFANYYRDVLGLAYQYRDSAKVFRFGGASSKGTFISNTFTGENGKQGPYRLEGQDGQRFKVVLAGSERVYLNGRLMERGQDRDYTIDYNLGELTFTPKNVIDANTRIVVDFTYIERSYARSFLTASYADTLFNNRLAITVGWTREADDPASPLDLALSNADKTVLANAGDDSNLAFTSGIDTVGYSPIEIRYAAKDTLVEGRIYTDVLVISKDSLEAIYRVSFAYVGEGKGDYIREGSTTNGNRFRWSPPTAEGNQTGNYAPLRQLPLPQMKQVGFLQADYRLGEHLHLFTETAVSENDLNRLSDFDGGDNTGYATRSGIRIQNLKTTSGWQISGEAAFQYVDRQFTNVDRVYEKEYGRRWNYDDLAPRATERLGEGSLQANWKNRIRLRAEGGYRTFGDSLKSSRFEMTIISNDSASVVGEATATYLRTDDTFAEGKSNWLRTQGTMARLVRGNETEKGWQVGSRFWLERRRDVLGDSLLQSSFEFSDLTPFLGTFGERTLQLEGAINLRYDRAAIAGELRNKSRTIRPSLTWTLVPNERFYLSAKATWQDFRVLDSLFETTSVRSLKGWLFDSELRYTSKDRGLTVNTFYRAATQQVSSLALSYLEVAAGQGQYEWLDYNNDGIQDLNEFELSTNPLLANYIRLFSPTQELQPAVGISLGSNLSFRVAALFKEEPTGILRVLHQLSTQTVLRASQQAERDAAVLGSYAFRFSEGGMSDTTVLNSSYSLRQEFYFYRNQPRGDFSFGLLLSGQQQLLGTGIEQVQGRVYTARQRYNFAQRHNLENTVQIVTRERNTQAFDQSNYQLEGWNAQPGYGFQLSARSRFGINLSYGEKRANILNEGEMPGVKTLRFTAETRYSYGKRNSIVGRAAIVQHELRGEPTGNLRFDLLESLQPGRNAVWNLLFVQYLSQTLELSVVYDGRAAQAQIAQHAIRMQLRALF